jgi:hypothetical protein
MSGRLTLGMAAWLAAFTRTGNVEATCAQTGVTAERWSAWQANPDFVVAKTAVELSIIADLERVAAWGQR